MPVFDRAKTIQAAEKHVRAGKFLEAVAEYRKLADDNPRDMNVLNKLGDLLTRAGKNQDALRCFVRIADFYSKDGFFLKAIAMYKKISKLDPSNLDCQKQLASLYERQNLSGEAKAQYLLVSEQLLRKGQSQAAAEMLQKVLEIEPDNQKVRSTLAGILGKGSKGGDAGREYCQAARAAIARGATSETLQALRKAVHANPGLEDLPEVLLALVTKIETTPKDLAALAEQVLKAAPKSGLAAVGVAEAYRREGRRAEADAAYRRLDGTEFLPETLSADAMDLVARWHSGAGRDAEGYEWLNRAVERYARDTRFQEAGAALDAFLAGHPLHRQALSARAEVAVRAEDPEAEAAALLRLAPILIEAVEHERAMEVIERLRKLRPADPAVEDLQTRLQPPVAMAESVEEEPGESPSLEPREAEEIFSIEEEDSLPEADVATPAPLIAVAATDEIEISTEETAYGPVSKIQEIQAADGDGKPIDEEFISEHLTEAEVFLKYGLLAKAREQLLAILERYPQDMAAHQRLIEVHVGEGNTEQAVKECLLLADMKKAQGHDAEVRELVNEAIRIAGPGSPLVERYTAGLESTGAAPKSGRKHPAPVSAAPRPDIPRKAETRRPPAAASKPPATVPGEIDLEMPEEAEPPVPAKPPVPDFAATTARTRLRAEPERPEEEAPEDRPSRGSSVAAGLAAADLLEIDGPAAGDGESFLSAIAKAPAREPDSEKLGEVDFYMEQGLTDEARQVLSQLRKQYPNSRTVVERIRRLDNPDKSEAPRSAEASPESNLDLEVEQALGGRSAQEDSGKQDTRPAASKGAPGAAKARPVFKVEEKRSDDEGEFIDLAKELDASLADEPQRRGTTAPDSLEGPGHTFDEVLAAFRKGVEQQVDREDYDTHYNLGIAYKEMGLVDEAIGEFQFAARDPSRTVECCGILGICFRDRGMPDLALKWYRRGLDMPGLDDHKAMGLRYDMAEVYRDKGEYDQALKLYTEVYGVDSNYRDVSARIKEVKGHLASPSRR